MVWLWGLTVGLLLGTLLGFLLARWPYRRHEQRGQAGSVTDLGESLALAYELRREIKRLSEENLRLWEERAELVNVFGRVVEFLQQEVGQIWGKALGPKSETTKPRRDSGITRGSEVWEANGNRRGPSEGNDARYGSGRRSPR